MITTAITTSAAMLLLAGLGQAAPIPQNHVISPYYSPITPPPRHYSAYFCDGPNWTGNCQNMDVELGCHEVPWEKNLSIGPGEDIKMQMYTNPCGSINGATGEPIWYSGEPDVQDGRAEANWFYVSI